MEKLITVYDPLLALCALALIPVVWWWRRQTTTSNVKLLGYFLIIFFAQGSINLLHVFNETLVRYALELPIIGLYILQLWRGYKKRSLPGHGLIGVFILAACISAFQTNVTMNVLFCLYYLEVFFAFLYFRNGLEQTEREQINDLFVYLCIAQIFAAFIKLGLVGIIEPYIGTMSAHEGGLTTLFSLAAFSFSLLFFINTRERKYLLLAIGFVAFGIIGEKRALAFFFPVLYFISVVLHSLVTRSWIRNSGLLLSGLIVAPLLFYTVCRMSPTLNPDQKIGGRFDLEYVLEYSDKYNHAEIGEDDDVGRAEAITVFHQRFFHDTPFHILFGYGSGTLVSSSFNEVGNILEFSQKKFGIGYSIGIGYIRLLAQVGIIGTVSYFLLFIVLLVHLYKRLRQIQQYLTEEELAYCCGAIITLVVVLIVNTTYNSSAFYLNCCSLAIMWFTSYALSILDQVESEIKETPVDI